MKRNPITTIVATMFLLSVMSPIALADSKNPEYVVKSFKLLGDEAVSNALTGFSRKNNLVVISCDVDSTDLVCVFEKRQ